MPRPAASGIRILPVLWAALVLAAPSGAERVALATADGFTLVGDLHAAAPEAPGVILLHMYRSDRRAWDPLVPKLREAGFTVLALDQRAHGESTRRGAETVRVADLPRGGFAAFVRAGPKDVAAARKLLAKRGLAKGGLALVGASYGCSVSLLSAAAEPGVGALVLLSPGTAYFGVDVTEAARRFAGALLGVAAEDDPGSARGTRALVEAHPGPDELVIFPSGGHGTRLFAPRPALADRVVEFLGGALAH